MANALLIAGIVLPIVVFWMLRSRPGLPVRSAAAMAVVAGWLLNIGWAFASGESLAIAGAMGWFCPAVLVALAWFIHTRRHPTGT
jgi:hypothetical protein